MYRTTLVALLVALNAGCAALAVRPPTPAARLSHEDVATPPPPPGERYFLVVFGSQSTPKRAKYTHTWATVVRTVDGPPGTPPVVAETHTISWMPATLDIYPLRFEVEPGVNLSLDDTLRMAKDYNERVSMWGPYEIWHGLYRRFLIQKQFLESGQVGYQCVDDVGESGRAGTGSDCIHAVTDMDPAYSRTRYPLIFYGESASANLVRRFMHAPVIIDPPRTHDWVIPQLGLDHYPVARREYRGRVVPYRPDSPGLDRTPPLVRPAPAGLIAEPGRSGPTTPRGG